MDKTVISIMLLPGMLALVAGIMLAGTLANLSNVTASGTNKAPSNLD
jgi:hypothetical protein